MPFLKLTGTVVGGWLMAKAAQVSVEHFDDADGDFYRAKVTTARYYAAHVLPEANSLRDAIVNGADSVLELSDSQF